MNSQKYGTANSRWAGVGPYYAMFPTRFADEVIREYSHPGDLVLDPFAGRGTAVFSAASQDRAAIGIEINPVGYVYAAAKLRTAAKCEVKDRLIEIGSVAAEFRHEAEDLPEFFQLCYSLRVREFLLAARARLNWRRSKTDHTLMALLLVYLHGKKGQSLSNQLRQTKSMSPQYAVRWWNEHQSDPPDIDPIEFIHSRLLWRYRKGLPTVSRARVYLGDCRSVLPRLQSRILDRSMAKAKLLLTSPPYLGITNYHYDQWIRLWLLGGPPNALRVGNSKGGKFENRDAYRALIEKAFSDSAALLDDKATVYVRTDSRQFTYQTTIEVLARLFPRKRLTEIPRPLTRPSQTRLFTNPDTVVESCGEVDLILTP